MNPFRTILLLTVLAASSSASAAEKPNVIVILADDLGWADLGAQNQTPDVKTPHLDDLADRRLEAQRRGVDGAGLGMAAEITHQAP